eukprot:TRINITY_DN1241_c0_g3_i1.p1 TRINITY_DN1241_c0_g3~~TRINITY_DN1241_c0_g3_i1.p1  ORF type:complete len:570 (+),score=80.11 TRINITY_DN1241_c0_g3_i1:366-2075(+)
MRGDSCIADPLVAEHSSQVHPEVDVMQGDASKHATAGDEANVAVAAERRSDNLAFAAGKAAAAAALARSGSPSAVGRATAHAVGEEARRYAVCAAAEAIEKECIDVGLNPLAAGKAVANAVLAAGGTASEASHAAGEAAQKAAHAAHWTAAAASDASMEAQSQVEKSLVSAKAMDSSDVVEHAARGVVGAEEHGARVCLTTGQSPWSQHPQQAMILCAEQSNRHLEHGSDGKAQTTNRHLEIVGAHALVADGRLRSPRLSSGTHLRSPRLSSGTRMAATPPAPSSATASARTSAAVLTPTYVRHISPARPVAVTSFAQAPPLLTRAAPELPRERSRGGAPVLSGKAFAAPAVEPVAAPAPSTAISPRGNTRTQAPQVALPVPRVMQQSVSQKSVALHSQASNSPRRTTRPGERSPMQPPGVTPIAAPSGVSRLVSRPTTPLAVPGALVQPPRSSMPARPTYVVHGAVSPMPGAIQVSTQQGALTPITPITPPLRSGACTPMASVMISASPSPLVAAAERPRVMPAAAPSAFVWPSTPLVQPPPSTSTASQLRLVQPVSLAANPQRMYHY